MFSMIKRTMGAIVLSLTALAGAQAAPVTYLFVGDIVGTLDGAAVSGQLTLSVTGDTGDLSGTVPQFLLNPAASTFALAGIGNFTVTNSSYVFARPDLGMVGFGVQGLASCCDIIQISNASLSGYDLNDAIGPVLGPPNPSLVSWFDVPTTSGLFTLTSMTNNTYQAVIGVSTVSEPATPALLALAGAGAWITRRRKPLTVSTGVERAD